MGIPQEIRDIERPPNTVVLPPVKDGSYPVRERIGCKREKGQNRPVSGCIVGHIINGVFVADDLDIVEMRRRNIENKKSKEKNTKNDEITNKNMIDAGQRQGKNENDSRTAVDSNGSWEGLNNSIEKVKIKVKDVEQGVQILAWGSIAFAYILMRPLFTELAQCYAVEDVKLIVAMVILKVCNREVPDCDLQQKYLGSVLKFLIPNISIGRNNVSVFQKCLGQRYSQIVSFMRLRTAALQEYEPIIIDGTLKSDESKVNHLSESSRKAKDKGTNDISVLVLLSAERHELICSMCFSGNIPDASSFPRILEEYNITRGLLVGDKGFPVGSIKEWVNGHPELHYLLPVKRNSKYISKHNLRDYRDNLENMNTVLYKKVYDEEDKVWVYSFHNSSIASREHKSYVRNFTKRSDNFLDALKDFGDIDLVSDLDLSPERAYGLVTGRWEIEVTMRFYKMALGFDQTRLHADPSVIGGEFIDFLASLLHYRMIQKFIELNILKNTKTFKAAKETLGKALIAQPVENEPWVLNHLTQKELSTLKKLGLIDGDAAVPLGAIPPILVKRQMK